MTLSILKRTAAVAFVAVTMAACATTPPPAPVVAVAPPPPPPPPVEAAPPARMGSITVFTGTNYRGASAVIDHDVPDLAGSGIDNRISSFKVSGGRWELCSRPEFKGRCIKVGATMRMLGKKGMANKIESIRRIG